MAKPAIVFGENGAFNIQGNYSLPPNDGTAGQVMQTNGSGVMSWVNGGGMSGPGSSTDHALPRFDGAGGGTLQNSGVTLDDSNNLTFPSGSQIFAPQNLTGSNAQYSFANDTNGGMLRTGSQLRIRFTASDKILVSSANVTIANQLLADAGSAGTPGVGFDGDPNTGMYRSGADEIGFSAGGTQRMSISTTEIDCSLPHRLPRYTDTQRNALTPQQGWMIFNTDDSEPNWYDGTNWKLLDGTIT